MADFYKTVFGRNSIDDAGITMASSVHYGTNFNNAFWNGSRMTYGEPDGNIFIDFTNSTDVIAHENRLTALPSTPCSCRTPAKLED